MAIHNKQVILSRDELINNNPRKGSLLAILYSVVRLICIIVQNIYCISSYLILSWILFFPISFLKRDLYYRIENRLYNSLLFIVASWSLAAEITVVETGDDFKKLIDGTGEHEERTGAKSALPNGKSVSNDIVNNSYPVKGDDETSEQKKTNKIYESEDDLIKVIESNNLLPDNYPKSDKICNNNLVKNGGPWGLSLKITKPKILLLCNHVSTADVPLLMQSFSTMKNNSLLWVLDAQFKLTNFGLVCSSHGDFFIAKGTFTDGSLKNQALQFPDRNILILFPEGGFLRKRIEGSNRYAVRNGLALTKYVTHPRFGAFRDLIDPNVGVTHIVDATLMYDDIKDPPSILDIVLGNRKENAVIHYRIHKRQDIEPTEEWLREIWLDKEKLLQHYYENRDSVYKYFGRSIRACKLDWMKLIAVHLFYLVVCYLVFRLLS